MRAPDRAVELAERVARLQPTDAKAWNHLGVARYAAGKPRSAIEALQKSIELRHDQDVYNWLFLAMAHGQLDEQEEAHKWYDRAIEWMDENKPEEEDLRRFRTEAAELLGVTEEDGQPRQPQQDTDGEPRDEQ